MGESSTSAAAVLREPAATDKRVATEPSWHRRTSRIVRLLLVRVMRRSVKSARDTVARCPVCFLRQCPAPRSQTLDTVQYKSQTGQRQKSCANFVTHYHYIRYYLPRPAPIASPMPAGIAVPKVVLWAIIANWLIIYSYDAWSRKVAISAAGGFEAGHHYKEGNHQGCPDPSRGAARSGRKFSLDYLLKYSRPRLLGPLVVPPSGGFATHFRLKPGLQTCTISLRGAVQVP
jgi:hypothetical protein